MSDRGARAGGPLRLGLAALLMLVGASVAAAEDAAVGDFVARVDRAVSALAGKSGAAAQSGCLALLRALVDTDAVARRVAGGAWNRMTATQRTRFVTAVEARAARECTLQNRNNSGAPVALVGVRPASGGDRLVATRVEQKGAGARTVVWRVAHGPPPLMAHDLLVDGRSTALTLRDEASAVLDRTNGDLEALIAALAR